MVRRGMEMSASGGKGSVKNHHALRSAVIKG
jgi:hypothetical protein